ncbi:hypothetical protein BY458DRAFT_512243 [Sporodiniella umbellata]|nr:hypothetical protein BY458DRAFT_512243 [Sporodiniella umbellata]
MCDLNWCPVCEKSIHTESDLLYCSVECFLEDNRTTKASVLEETYSGFLHPKSCSLDFHYSSISISKNTSITTSIPPSMITSNTLDSLSSKEDDSDNEEEQHIFSCCDYCENQVEKSRDKPFQDIYPSYNPLWSEKLPDMDDSQDCRFQEATF